MFCCFATILEDLIHCVRIVCHKATDLDNITFHIRHFIYDSQTTIHLELGFGISIAVQERPFRKL